MALRSICARARVVGSTTLPSPPCPGPSYNHIRCTRSSYSGYYYSHSNKSIIRRKYSQGERKGEMPETEEETRAIVEVPFLFLLLFLSFPFSFFSLHFPHIPFPFICFSFPFFESFPFFTLPFPFLSFPFLLLPFLFFFFFFFFF